MTEEGIHEELATISEMLEVAEEFGLIDEVIYWALKSMKDDPTLTPAEAMALGVAEWVK